MSVAEGLYYCTNMGERWEGKSLSLRNFYHKEKNFFERVWQDIERSYGNTKEKVLFTKITLMVPWIEKT